MLMTKTFTLAIEGVVFLQRMESYLPESASSSELNDEIDWSMLPPLLVLDVSHWARFVTLCLSFIIVCGYCPPGHFIELFWNEN